MGYTGIGKDDVEWSGNVGAKASAPVKENHLTRKDYVDAQDEKYLLLDGSNANANINIGAYNFTSAGLVSTNDIELKNTSRSYIMIWDPTLTWHFRFGHNSTDALIYTDKGRIAFQPETFVHVAGGTTLAGEDAPINTDALDVLTVTGGTGGIADPTGGDGADILLTAGDGGAGGAGDTGGKGGAITLTAGEGGDGATQGVGGDINIATQTTTGTPGDINLTVENAGGGVPGGNMNLTLGTAPGGTQGNIILTNLPTADPSVAGALWNDSGTIKISAG